MAKKTLSFPTNRLNVKKAEALCLSLPLVENEARQAGLYKTAQAINVAVKAMGWEFATLLVENREKGKKQKSKKKGN